MNNRTKVRDLIPRPQGDELLTLIKKAISNGATKIIIDSTKPYMVVERPSTTDTGNEPLEFETELYNAVRKSEMEEFQYEAGQDPYKTLYQMFDFIQKEGFEVSNILCSNRNALQTWLQTKLPRGQARIFGVPVSYNGALPTEVIVVCGAPTKDSEPWDIKLTIKGTMAQ